MEISSSTLPAVAAERATMFVALELSKSSWLVALHSTVADKVSLHRFVGGDVAGLLALIARKQAQAEVRLGRTIRVLSCYEGGMTDFGYIGCCAPAALITGYSMPPVFSSTGAPRQDRSAGCGGVVTYVDGARSRRAPSLPRGPGAERRARRCTASQPGTRPAGRR